MRKLFLAVGAALTLAFGALPVSAKVAFVYSGYIDPLGSGIYYSNEFARRYELGPGSYEVLFDSKATPLDGVIEFGESIDFSEFVNGTPYGGSDGFLFLFDNSVPTSNPVAFFNVPQGGVSKFYDPNRGEVLDTFTFTAGLSLFFADFALDTPDGTPWSITVLSLPALPEPGTWVMMLVGFAGLGMMLRLKGARQPASD